MVYTIMFYFGVHAMKVIFEKLNYLQERVGQLTSEVK